MKWYAALLHNQVKRKKEGQNEIFHGQGNISWCLPETLETGKRHMTTLLNCLTQVRKITY
jgi:hypothetical protein